MSFEDDTAEIYYSLTGRKPEVGPGEFVAWDCKVERWCYGTAKAFAATPEGLTGRFWTPEELARVEAKLS